MITAYYEDAVRNAISLDGDTDTQGCITGGIADAYCGGIPDFIANMVQEILTEDLWSFAENMQGDP